MAELPGYPNTLAHIATATTLVTVEEEATVDDMIEESNPVSQADAVAEEDTTEQPSAHEDEQPEVQAPVAAIETPETPKTPAVAKTVAPSDEISPPQEPSTPVQAPVAAIETPKTLSLTETVAPLDEESAPQDPSTPIQATTPFTDVAAEFFNKSQIPSEIVWGVTNQEAFAEMPAYPTTPAHITAPVTTKQALAELPDYPKTPAHIVAPVSTRQALAELPSYPTTPAMVIEAAIQEEITASVKKQTPSPLRFPGLEDVSFQFADTSEYTDVDSTEIGNEVEAVEVTQRIPLAPIQLAPSMPIPEPVSPRKSALRSPQKMDAKTPKKAVTWDDPEESLLFLHDGPLQGMTFYVDVTSNGKDQNYLFAGLLEDLGAKTTKDWNENTPSHVLFKDGGKNTLEKVVASKGAMKCVNIGWVLDSEKNKKRMEEAPYLVDLSVAMPASPLPTTSVQPFTPARTPSKYALPPSSECKSIPTTPTSSEFDRSINFDDKENSEHGIYFDEPKQVRTVPPKKSSFLLSRSPIKTPSKPSFLLNTPVRPMSAIKPFSTSKKRCAESSFASISLGTPKKFRLF